MDRPATPGSHPWTDRDASDASVPADVTPADASLPPTIKDQIIDELEEELRRAAEDGVVESVEDAIEAINALLHTEFG